MTVGEVTRSVDKSRHGIQASFKTQQGHKVQKIISLSRRKFQKKLANSQLRPHHSQKKKNQKIVNSKKGQKEKRRAVGKYELFS